MRTNKINIGFAFYKLKIALQAINLKTSPIDEELRQFLEKIIAFANKKGIAFITGNIYGVWKQKTCTFRA